MEYIVYDRNKYPFACPLLGSAAWKIPPRDDTCGWDTETRKNNLSFLTNNMRFLILPWIRVPHVASHIFGQVARRISADWEKKYRIRFICSKLSLKTNAFAAFEEDSSTTYRPPSSDGFKKKRCASERRFSDRKQ